VPASLGDAARSVTKGSVDKNGGQVRALVKITEEQNPTSPGWTLKDADLAASRLGINFNYTTSGTWSQLQARRAEGRMIVLQGDSDVFTSGCSSAFDGNHCIVIHPNSNDVGDWLTGDPICLGWRWEDETTLRRYAEKFGGGTVLFGYTDIVPLAINEEADVAVVITITPQTGRFTIPANQSVIGLKVDPTTGLVSERKTWAPNPNPSSASYDARITTTAFRGNPFIRGSNGFFDDYWISTAQVEEVPDAPAPPQDCSTQVIAAKQAGMAEGIAAEKLRVRNTLGI